MACKFAVDVNTKAFACVVTRAVLVPEDGEVVTMIEHIVEAEVIPLILRKQRIDLNSVVLTRAQTTETSDNQVVPRRVVVIAVRFLFGLCNTEALDLLEATTALVNNNHTDGTSPVFLLAWEHGAKVSKNPESPKSPSKNPCLSGFQVGRTLGNVKTAEVRSRLSGWRRAPNFESFSLSIVFYMISFTRKPRLVGSSTT